MFSFINNYKFFIVILTILFNILYLVTFLEMSEKYKKYMNVINYTIRFLIGLYLVLRFNIFNKEELYFKKYDKTILFNAGLLLLLSTSVISYIKYNVEKNIQNNLFDLIN